MIEMRDLQIAYGDFIAVDGLTLTVPKGTCYGFIGPNGAGKTSTMRTLATLIPPAGGVMSVCGHDVAGDPDGVRRCIGYMPDFFGVYDQLSVAEYLEFFALSYGVPSADIPDRIDDTLAKVRLEVKKDTYIDTLSRGMKQRLSLGRAFIHNPPVLILDEPASGLDPRARKEFRLLLKELQDEGKTIFISSHILLELADTCDHAAIIEAGKLVVAGPIETILHQVRQFRHMAVRLCAPPTPEALGAVRALACVSRATAAENALAVEVDDRDDAVAEIVVALVASGAAVAEVRAMESNLEEIFEKVTRGIAR
jgi:ABC-2 type transport system ATP-binding protein